jgi:hypothetical protein
VKHKNVYLAAALVVSLGFIGTTLAQHPENDIDPKKHPALAEAQHHLSEANAKIEESQRYYKDNLGGHAEKARQLIEQASHELKEAAEYANHNDHK